MIEKWLNILGKKKKEVLNSLRNDGQATQKNGACYVLPDISLYNVSFKPYLTFYNNLNSITLCAQNSNFSREVLLNLRDELISQNFELIADSLNHETTTNLLSYEKSKQMVTAYQNEDSLVIQLEVKMTKKEILSQMTGVSYKDALVRWIFYLIGGLIFGLVAFACTLSETQYPLNIYLSIGSGASFGILYGLSMELADYFSVKNARNKKKPKVYKTLTKKAKEQGLENGMPITYTQMKRKGHFNISGGWYGLFFLSKSIATIFYQKGFVFKRLDIPIESLDEVKYNRIEFIIKAKEMTHNFFFIDKISDEEMNKIDDTLGYSGEKYDAIFTKVHVLFTDYNFLSIYDAKDSPYLEEIEFFERMLVQKLFRSETLSRKQLQDLFNSYFSSREDYYDEEEPELINTSSYYGSFSNYLLDHLTEETPEIYTAIVDLQNEGSEKPSTEQIENDSLSTNNLTEEGK